MTRVSDEVQLERLRPRQIEAALRAFPAMFVPLGLIEWHGHHLPVGVDALKVHGVLVRTAQLSGGLVYPPIYALHAGLDDEATVAALGRILLGIRNTGVRVIVGVSGHNVRQQIELFERALRPATSDEQCVGCALWETSLCRDPNVGTDHAAKWETSDMMALHEDLVDLNQLGTEQLGREPMLVERLTAPWGIKGLDPRSHASAQVGRRCLDRCAAAIAERARQLLLSLPPERRSFHLPGIEFEHWKGI